jgi:amino acid transporter
VTYVAQFWPSAHEKAPRVIVITVVLGVVTAVNYVGVRRGTFQSNVFTVAKLATLGGFILAALVFLGMKHQPLVVSLPAGPFKSWRDAILLLVFAYGGYETALMPGGEARNPRRDYPFALFVALVVCTVVFTMTQWVIISLLPQASITDRPLATAAQFMFGGGGAAILSIGVLVSCYGYLSANVLGFPRILFALAEHGDLPRVMARVHPRFRTPYIAIMVFAVLLYAFSLAGSFRWNVVISAVSRLFYYGSVCAALPVLRLRRKSGIPDAQFHLPMGNLIAALAVATSLLLLLSFPKLDLRDGIVLAVVALGVFMHSLWASRQGKESGVASLE